MSNEIPSEWYFHHTRRSQVTWSKDSPAQTKLTPYGTNNPYLFSYGTTGLRELES